MFYQFPLSDLFASFRINPYQLPINFSNRKSALSTKLLRMHCSTTATSFVVAMLITSVMGQLLVQLPVNDRFHNILSVTQIKVAALLFTEIRIWT